jgi:predicted GNAT family acetyltransferase
MGKDDAMTDQIADNRDAERFELAVGDQVVFALYRRDGDRLFIRHVEAPFNLRGTGVAGRLMAAIMERARAEHVTVTPLCSYAAAWLRRHPEHADLVG